MIMVWFLVAFAATSSLDTVGSYAEKRFNYATEEECLKHVDEFAKVVSYKPTVYIVCLQGYIREPIK